MMMIMIIVKVTAILKEMTTMMFETFILSFNLNHNFFYYNSKDDVKKILLKDLIVLKELLFNVFLKFTKSL